MKDIFDIFLILIITLTMFICMMFFAEEVAISNEAVHLRNRVIEILEINSGYTDKAKEEVKDLIENSKRNIIVNISKEGKLLYGEKVIIEVVMFYDRRLPFNNYDKQVKYSIMGEYYNTND